MIQVNLIPDVKLELVKAQRHRNFIIAISILTSAAAGLVLVMILGWVFVAQQIHLSSLTTNIKEKHEEFMAIEDIEETVTISNQLAYIDSSHEQKAISSRLFDVMNASSMQGTDNSIAISAFNVDTENNTVTITAQTERSGYDAVDVYVKNLEALEMYYIEAEQDEIPNALRSDGDRITEHDDEMSELVASDIAVYDLAYTEGQDGGSRVVSFRVSFTYSDLLFSDSIDLLRLEGLEGGNVTDSYQRLPESLFTQSSRTEGEN